MKPGRVSSNVKPSLVATADNILEDTVLAIITWKKRDAAPRNETRQTRQYSAHNDSH